MDTPVSKTAATSGHLPVNLFLKALDYKFKEDRSTTPPTPARVVIMRTRQEQLSELRHLVAKFQRTTQAVIDADQHGFAEAPADLLVVLGEEITAKSQQLYQDIQDARTRYLGPSVAVVTEGPETTGIATRPDDGHAGAGMVVTIKPTDIHYPLTMADVVAIGRAKRAEFDGITNQVLRTKRP